MGGFCPRGFVQGDFVLGGILSYEGSCPGDFVLGDFVPEPFCATLFMKKEYCWNIVKNCLK